MFRKCYTVQILSSYMAICYFDRNIRLTFIGSKVMRIGVGSLGVFMRSVGKFPLDIVTSVKNFLY